MSHLIERPGQFTEFVLASNQNTLIIAPVGDALASLRHFLDWAHDTASHKGANENSGCSRGQCRNQQNIIKRLSHTLVQVAHHSAHVTPHHYRHTCHVAIYSGGRNKFSGDGK